MNIDRSKLQRIMGAVVASQALLQIGSVINAMSIPSWARNNNYLAGGLVGPGVVLVIGLVMVYLLMRSISLGERFRLTVAVYEIAIIGLSFYGPRNIASGLSALLSIVTLTLITIPQRTAR